MAIENQKQIDSTSYLCEDYFIKVLFHKNITWILSPHDRSLFDELFKLWQGEWDMVLDSYKVLNDTSFLFQETWKHYVKTLVGERSTKIKY